MHEYLKNDQVMQRMRLSLLPSTPSRTPYPWRAVPVSNGSRISLQLPHHHQHLANYQNHPRRMEESM